MRRRVEEHSRRLSADQRARLRGLCDRVTNERSPAAIAELVSFYATFDLPWWAPAPIADLQIGLGDLEGALRALYTLAGCDDWGTAPL